jgi:Arc/MetJ family transcription regulator
MSIKRKSHNLDESLLRRAKRVLGTTTETETIHTALRAVLQTTPSRHSHRPHLTPDRDDRR